MRSEDKLNNYKGRKKKEVSYINKLMFYLWREKAIAEEI